MKTENSKEVRIAYLKFTGYLLATIVLTVFIIYFFMKASSVEVESILSKTEEYDKIYSKQLMLTASVDSVFQYVSLLNTSPKINDLLLQSVISNKKMALLDNLNSMNDKDCRIYKKVINDMNIFLRIKDSIRIINIQEDLVRSDLLRCVDENKQVVRRLSAGGLTFEKK
ncbi:type VI secretion system transmembrane protein TssQ [Bacteroides fragilis]|uniref:Type VI secretion system transmembrane protein TssQ n=1 Tax=Bacteroides fragilis TaxID=817 RepID=A0A396BSJ8_BACFG|nr:type VI secretion system TssO [Bacteroides fragilis]RHH07902.1 type VI secretion system transmembrane protein TssQ [Bacteroides fragilis]